MSYPSHLDGIQIEIGPSSGMPKFRQFFVANGYCHIFAFCITFRVLPVTNCKLDESIGCRQTVCKYWMQHHCKLFASVGCRIISSIQSVSSAFSYRNKATIDAGIHASKLSVSIGCRQIVASITRPCIQFSFRYSGLYPTNIFCYPG